MVKTEKYFRPTNVIALALLFLTLAGVSGCANALFTAAYLIKGNEVDPEFKKEVKEIPKHSKMVVICRSPYQTLFGIDDPSKTLSVALTKALADKLDERKKLEWIPIDRLDELLFVPMQRWAVRHYLGRETTAAALAFIDGKHEFYG